MICCCIIKMKLFYIVEGGGVRAGVDVTCSKNYFFNQQAHLIVNKRLY